MPATLGRMTAHGTATYLEGIDAAQQAGADIAAIFQTTPGPEDKNPIQTTSAVISAISALGSATFAAGNFAVAVANVVHTFQVDEKPGNLELTIANLSSQPVSTYSFEPFHANVSHAPQPLSPGSSGVFLLTREAEFPVDTSAILDFLVGAGENNILLRLVMTYTDEGTPGRWAYTAELDYGPEGGGSAHEYERNLNLCGATFAGHGDYPSFSFYMMPVETPSGALSLSFYDVAA